MLGGEDFKSEEDETDCELFVLFFLNLFVYLIEGVHIHFLVVLFYEVALIVVLIEFY